jgi:hypothetical protein
MSSEIILRQLGGLLTVPAIIAGAGDHTARRFLETDPLPRLSLERPEPPRDGDRTGGQCPPYENT